MVRAWSWTLGLLLRSLMSLNALKLIEHKGDIVFFLAWLYIG